MVRGMKLSLSLGGSRPDAAVASTRREQLKQFVTGVMRIFNNLVSLLPAALSVEVLHGLELRPGDGLGSFHHPLQGLTVEGGATAVPGGDAVCQDTLYGAPVEVAEYPGVHVEPLQPAEEEEPLSRRLCDGVGVVSPGQVLADVDPEELETADSLYCHHFDGDGGVLGSLSLPVVHNHSRSFAEVELEVVVLPPRCQGSHLLSVRRLVAIGDQADDGRVVSKLGDGVGAVCGHWPRSHV